MKKEIKIISKSNKKIDIETLKNHIEEYFWDDTDSRIFQRVVTVHLIIDEILKILIDKNGLQKEDSFSKRNKLLNKNSILDKNLYNILREFNKIRNNYAHNYLYSIKDSELHKLVELAQQYKLYYDEDVYSEPSSITNESNESLIFNLLYNLTLKLSERYLS